MKLTEAEKQERLQLLSQGLSCKEISARLYLSEHSVKNWCRRNGIKIKTDRCEAHIRSERMRQELPTLADFKQAAGDGAGATYDRVSERYSVARSTAYDHWRELRRLNNAN